MLRKEEDAPCLPDPDFDLVVLAGMSLEADSRQGEPSTSGRAFDSSSSSSSSFTWQMVTRLANDSSLVLQDQRGTSLIRCSFDRAQVSAGSGSSQQPRSSDLPGGALPPLQSRLRAQLEIRGSRVMVRDPRPGVLQEAAWQLCCAQEFVVGARSAAGAGSAAAGVPLIGKSRPSAIQRADSHMHPCISGKGRLSLKLAFFYLLASCLLDKPSM